MAELSSLFILAAILHGNGDSFSITALATFPSELACNRAADAVNAAMKDGTGAADVGCLSGKGIEALKGR